MVFPRRHLKWILNNVCGLIKQEKKWELEQSARELRHESTIKRETMRWDFQTAFSLRMRVKFN